MERLNPNFWKERNVLVTGATGLVGSWLIKDLLERQSQIVVLVRDVNPQSELYRSRDIERVTVVNGELESLLTIERALTEYEIDTVFHLGAQTLVGAAHRLPLATFESNVRGTYHLLEACRMRKDLVKRIVIASTDKVYGDQPKLPYQEDMFLKGRFPYDVSKSCADLIAQSYFHTYQLPIVITRCGNIYGGGDLNWSRIVPGTVRSLYRRERPIIRSDGSYLRDYLYVKDVVAAYLALAESLEKNTRLHGEAFNISADEPLTVLEIVDMIQKLTQGEHLKPKILNSAKAEIRSQYLSCSKLRKTIGWKPKFDFKSGLSETIRWYHEFLAREK